MLMLLLYTSIEEDILLPCLVMFIHLFRMKIKIFHLAFSLSKTWLLVPRLVGLFQAEGGLARHRWIAGWWGCGICQRVLPLDDGGQGLLSHHKWLFVGSIFWGYWGRWIVLSQSLILGVRCGCHKWHGDPFDLRSHLLFPVLLAIGILVPSFSGRARSNSQAIKFKPCWRTVPCSIGKDVWCNPKPNRHDFNA